MLLRMQIPVMFDDWSDARKSTVLATSSGRLRRARSRSETWAAIPPGLVSR
jgi:hypothetical protein